jgi:hypothetical protein
MKRKVQITTDEEWVLDEYELSRHAPRGRRKKPAWFVLVRINDPFIVKILEKLRERAYKKGCGF